MKNHLLLAGLWLVAATAFAQNVKVKGVVKNSTDSVIAFRKNGFNAVTRARDGQRYKAKLNSKGEFEITLPEKAIQEWLIEQGDQFALLDLCTGHDLNLVIDFTQTMRNRVSATGPNAAEVNFLSYLDKKQNEKYGDFYEKLKGLNPAEVLKLRKERAEFQLATLEDYHRQNKLGDDYYKWLKTLYKYEPYERTLVEQLSAEQRADPNYVALLTANGFNDDYAAMHSSEYNDLANYYMHFKINGSKFPLKIADFFEFGTKDNLGGLTKQVFLTRQMMFFATNSKDSLYNAMLQKFKTSVNHKELLQVIADERNAYLAKLAKSNRSTENVSQSASLNEIFKKYKGKVIYLDFWASWCSPCRSEMPNARQLKNKLKGKDVVFLYFGYNDKKENWLAARKELEIEGEHYLLSPQLISEANQLFQLTGIPHYVIIGKDGTIIEKKAPRPLDAFAQLSKLAEEK